MDYSITELNCFPDERGNLVEMLRGSELLSGDGSGGSGSGAGTPGFGQIYMATIEPGHIRGNHYHSVKTEYYALLDGAVLLAVEDIATGERKNIEIEAGSGKAVRIRVGPKVAHAIKNISEKAIILCAYTNIEYNSENPDQKAHKLL